MQLYKDLQQIRQRERTRKKCYVFSIFRAGNTSRDLIYHNVTTKTEKTNCVNYLSINLTRYTTERRKTTNL